jgi:hypothetical protein
MLGSSKIVAYPSFNYSIVYMSEGISNQDLQNTENFDMPECVLNKLFFSFTEGGGYFGS